MQQLGTFLRRRRAKALAAICGLIALIAMAVTFAGVAASAVHNPGIRPEPGPMQMGETSIEKTPPTTPVIKFAAPHVRSPRPTA